MLEISEAGGAVNPLELIGKKVRYKGREGHVRSVHAGRDRPPALRIKLRVPASEPDRIVDVPESDWDEVEILSS
jgi:hypothetical protein